MDDSDSWLAQLASGDVSAAETLWRHFFTRLCSYAEICLRRLPPNTGEAEEVALSVFKSICRMIESRTIPSIRDREQLWPLLATIAARKVGKLIRRSRHDQNGRQIVETDLDSLGVSMEEVPILSRVIGREPSPEFALEVEDLLSELEGRLDVVDRSQRKERTIAELWLAGQTLLNISQTTGVPLRTVARKLKKIRRILKELVGEMPEDC